MSEHIKANKGGTYQACRNWSIWHGFVWTFLSGNTQYIHIIYKYILSFLHKLNIKTLFIYFYDTGKCVQRNAKLLAAHAINNHYRQYLCEVIELLYIKDSLFCRKTQLESLAWIQGNFQIEYGGILLELKFYLASLP